MQEPITLYKLMCLYMLSRIKSPLTNSQISNFMLLHDYTNYITLQVALSELEEGGLISSEKQHQSTIYQLTSDGSEAITYYGSQIHPDIKEDIDSYLRENRYTIRNELDVTAEYFKSTLQEYTVNLAVKEGKSHLIKLELNVPDEEQASLICDRWKSCNCDIYSYIIHTLMKSD